jgi:hypothetical protein
MMDEKTIGAITISYEIYTPESVEVGDAEERGWIDEEGFEIIPEDFDYEEYIEEEELSEDTSFEQIHDAVVARMAADFLKDEFADAPSNSSFSLGTWYTAYGEADYSTGETENKSFHLQNFTPAQEALIFEEMS